MTDATKRLEPTIQNPPKRIAPSLSDVPDDERFHGSDVQ